MVAETIVDGFGDFIVEPEQFSLMVQASFSTAIDLAELTIEKKLKAVADVLGLVDSEQAIQQLRLKLVPVFQEFSSSSFKYEEVHEEFISMLKRKIDTIKKQEWDLDEEDLNEFFESPDLKVSAEQMFYLGLHMNLNEPKLTFESGKCEYTRFNQLKHYCIDGFPKAANPCSIVIPPPKRNDKVYMGIKPSVLVLSEDDISEEILASLEPEQVEEETPVADVEVPEKEDLEPDTEATIISEQMTVRQIEAEKVESPRIDLPCQIKEIRRRKGTELSSCPSIGEEKVEDESSDIVVQEVFVRSEKAEELINTPQFESVTK